MKLSRLTRCLNKIISGVKSCTKLFSTMKKNRFAPVVLMVEDLLHTEGAQHVVRTDVVNFSGLLLKI